MMRYRLLGMKKNGCSRWRALAGRVLIVKLALPNQERRHNKSDLIIGHNWFFKLIHEIRYKPHRTNGTSSPHYCWLPTVQGLI